MGYSELKIEEFLKLTSSTSSMPGGGVVCALLGAEAVSLALKVCNLSLGKEKYKENEILIKESIEELKELRLIFYKLMDDDAREFKVMEEVYKMPQNTDDEKIKRKEALKNACTVCCKVPCKVITNSLLLIEKVNLLDGKTNVSAASDLKLAMMFAETAIRGAWENVEINLKYANDENLNKSVEPIMQKIMKLYIL